MDRATFEHEEALNRKAWEELRYRIRTEYAGQYVVIAHGRLIAASPDFEGASAVIHQLQPPPENYLLFPADEEPIFDVVDSISSEILPVAFYHDPDLNPATLEQEETANRRAWEEMRQEILCKYPGQVIGLAHGRLIAAAADWDEAEAAIRRLEPVPKYYVIFEAGTEPFLDENSGATGNH